MQILPPYFSSLLHDRDPLSSPHLLDIAPASGATAQSSSRSTRVDAPSPLDLLVTCRQCRRDLSRWVSGPIHALAAASLAPAAARHSSLIARSAPDAPR